MPLFEVMVPQRCTTGADPLESEFVRDRFSFGAALALPPIWALMHGLWLEMFGWVVGLVSDHGRPVCSLAARRHSGSMRCAALWFGSAASDLRVDSPRPVRLSTMPARGWRPTT